MNVTNLPPPDPALSRADAGSGPSPVARQPVEPIASSPIEPAASAADALADHVLIHPLDLTGAIRIMLAEVRAELPSPVVIQSMTGEREHVGGEGYLLAERLTETAPQSMVQLFLQALPPPEILEPAAWLTYVMEVEGNVQSALDRAVEAAAGWRDVPSAVVDGAKETRDLVIAAIADDPPNPLWLRPEWLGLAPQMERHRRRRKRARRWLSDPDLHWRERDEDLER